MYEHDDKKTNFKNATVFGGFESSAETSWVSCKLVCYWTAATSIYTL